MSEIYSWVKNIIIFLVLTTIISNLLGKNNYKKYINLISGLILVLLVVSPLLKLFQLEDTLDYYFSANFLLVDAEDLSDKLTDMEQGEMSAVFEEYKEKITLQISKLLEEQELYIVKSIVIVDEEETSNTFGNIIAMELELSYIRQEKNNPTTIDKIDIKSIEINKNKESDDGKNDNILSPSEINVKNLLSDFYNMNPDNINISIQEL